MNPNGIRPAYLDLSAVSNFVALSESSIQKLTRENEFPKARQLSGRRVGWLVRELDEWAEARPLADMLPPVGSGYGRAGKAAANVSI